MLPKLRNEKWKYYAKKNGSNRNAHVVLFELCKQIDDTQEELILKDDDENREHVGLDITDVDLF